MKIALKTKIEAPIEKAWQKLAVEFDRASDWMSVIPKSVEKTDGVVLEDAPMVGRLCDLSTKPNGPYVDETITSFEPHNYRFKVYVQPVGGNIPVVDNRITFSLEQVDAHIIEMRWDSDISLKTAGKLLYPVIKAGLTKGLRNQMEEFKYFVENDAPHPRNKS